MRIKWSLVLFDNHWKKIVKVEILHSNKDGMCGMCMLQINKYWSVGRGCKPMHAFYRKTLGLK
jgi:hypothetical protein